MRSLVGFKNRSGGAPISYAPSRAGAFSTGMSGSSTGSGTPNAAHLAAMGQVGTLSAIVGRTSEAVSQVHWRLFRKAKPGQPAESRVEVTRHAALDLWNQPNPFMPRQEFVETVQQHYELTGEQWWLVAKAGKLPLELWPVRPDRMRPVPHATEFLAGAIYRSPDGDEVPLKNEEVIFVRRPNPLDVYRGLGVVQSILVDLDSARFTAEWNRNFFLNSAEPGGIIQVDKRLSDDEFTEMVMRWREQHQGVAQAHRVAVLEQGQWIDRKFSMRDMQFPELRSLTSEMIREGFGFPKPLLGTVTDVNRANSEAAEVMFGRWLVIPRLERIKGALNGDLLPMYGPTAKDLEFDYDNPVPDDAELEMKQLTARTTAYALLTGSAGVTPESAAGVCGLPPMEHAEPAPTEPGAPGAPAETDAPGELIDTIGQDRQDDVDWGLFGGGSDDEQDTTDDEDQADGEGKATNRRPQDAWDPGKHPRDRKGRFTSSRTSKLTDAERDLARGVIGGFKPKQFADSASADAYVMGGPALPQDQADAVDSYSGDTFLDVNRKLRAGGDVSDDTTIRNLRAAMRPTEDDLILTRTVSFDAFPKGFNLEDLAGMKVKDAAFTSTSLGAAYGGTLGNVRMKIAVPAGTPAVFAAKYSRNPHEREIILGDGLEFAVASVTKNDQYGYDMSLIVLPKTPTTARAVVREMRDALADDARLTEALRRAVAAEVRSLIPQQHVHDRPADVVPPPPVPAPPADETPAELPDGVGPDPQPVQDQWEEALAALVVLWLLFAGGDDDARSKSRHGVAGIAGDLVEQVRSAVAAGDLAALTRLTVDAGLLEDAATQLGDRLVELGEAAARHVVTEAALQDVSLSAGAVDRAALRVTGQVAASTLADGLRITATREAARVWGPGVASDTVALHVADALTTLTPAQPEYVLGGAATAAEAAGREATMLAGPSAALYAREVNDRNRCGPCSAVDGKWVGNSDDPTKPWRSLYPVRGYLGCLGRDRCRGGLVAVWRGGKDWKQWVDERGGA